MMYDIIIDIDVATCQAVTGIGMGAWHEMAYQVACQPCHPRLEKSDHVL